MKKIFIVITIVAMLLMTASCGKKVECDFCGEEKVCEEKTVWGETVNICDDCTDEITDLFE